MKKAFTLAEVLITLGIIGVVAAISIPQLITNYQKKVTATKLKQTYSLINQAFKISIINNGNVDNWTYSSINEYTSTFWSPYLKFVKFCKTPFECGYKNNFPWYCRNANKNSLCVIYWYPWQTNSTYARNMLILANNSYILFNYNNKDIYIDINGPSEPNEFGKDFFALEINSNSVSTAGYLDNQATITANCSPNGQKDKCLTKIMRDGWEIKDDYPW